MIDENVLVSTRPASIAFIEFVIFERWIMANSRIFWSKIHTFSIHYRLFRERVLQRNSGLRGSSCKPIFAYLSQSSAFPADGPWANEVAILISNPIIIIFSFFITFKAEWCKVSPMGSPRRTRTWKFLKPRTWTQTRMRTRTRTRGGHACPPISA